MPHEVNNAEINWGSNAGGGGGGRNTFHLILKVRRLATDTEDSTPLIAKPLDTILGQCTHTLFVCLLLNDSVSIETIALMIKWLMNMGQLL
jgi:hypothetical protein